MQGHSRPYFSKVDTQQHKNRSKSTILANLGRGFVSQCDQIWQNFDKSLKVFCKFLMIYFLLGKMLSLLRQISDIIGLIFIVANGQIKK